MPHVPGLRSCYAKAGRLVYFGRMLDKIRLHAAGKLPADYIANLGDAKPGVFDTRCCQFLGVKFADLTRQTLSGGTDDQVLAWAHANGKPRSDEECEIWNDFLMKRGWRDAARSRLLQRIAEGGFQDKAIETFFDYIEYDEGRDPAVEKSWEKI